MAWGFLDLELAKIFPADVYYSSKLYQMGFYDMFYRAAFMLNPYLRDLTSINRIETAATAVVTPQYPGPNVRVIEREVKLHKYGGIMSTSTPNEGSRLPRKYIFPFRKKRKNNIE